MVPTSLKLEYIPKYVDKAFRILLSVILIWPQMAGGMQEVSNHGSPRERVRPVAVTELSRETEQLLPSGSNDLARENNFCENDPSSLETIEKSRWKGRLRWANLDNLLQRLGYALVLRKHEVTGESGCSCPVWLAGGAYPVASESARQRVLFIDGFRQGTEHVLFKTLDLFLFLSIYQIIHKLADKETVLPCQHYSESIHWWHLDINASLGFFHDILNLPYAQYIFPCLPPLWGMMKGVMNTRSSDISREEGTTQEAQSTSFHQRKKGLMTLVYEDFKLLAGLCCNFSQYLKGELSFEQLDGEINRYGTGNSKLAGFYGNTLRWLGPYHPIDWRLNVMMKNALWNSNVSEYDLRFLQNRLELLVKTQLGYTPLSALDHVKKIAFGMNARDRKAFGIEHLGDRVEAYTDLKRWAFDLLEKKAGNRDNEPAESEVCLLRWQDKANKAYARYLLWSLGQTGLCETLGFLLLKTVKLGLQVYSASEIYRGLYEVLNCPKEPGVSMAGVEPWAKDLTQECFAAQVQAFNTLPEQPTDTLVGNLDKFFFSNCTIDLDLSNKGLDGQTVANITRALREINITIRLLNLSGNVINKPQDFEAIFPILKKVTVLDLSNNGIENVDTLGTVALSHLLPKLSQLTSFHLSYNHIGVKNSNGTVALGKGLLYLFHLTSLDLRANNIGWTDSHGTVALSEGLSHLTSLTSLNLAENYINLKDSNGTVALSIGLSHLPNLTFLDLSYNAIGNTDSIGTAALGNGLSHLLNLSYLDLSHNNIGHTDSVGTISLAKGLSHLDSLIFLNLSTNFIGLCDSNGTIALGEGLFNLTNLVLIDFSHDHIRTGLGSFAKSFYNLHKLQTFNILSNPITNIDIEEVNKVLNYTLVSPLPMMITSPEDVGVFCQTLSPSARHCDLSGRMYSPSSETVIALMQCLKFQNSITSLDLTYNYIGEKDSSGIAALGAGLYTLPQLTSLNLSYNQIGNTDSNGTVILGKGLSYLSNLTVLDLSYNNIGQTDSLGTAALGEGLSHLSNLNLLNFMWNSIGSTDSIGTAALGDGLSHLSSLTFLTFARNQIGSINSNGTVALGKGLYRLSNLIFLDLSYNNIGQTDSLGTLALGEGISHLSNLTSFNLMWNDIGKTDSLGVIALAQGLNQTRNLRILNLGNNMIGSTGANEAQALISVLLDLPNLDLESLNIQGITNISWTNFSNNLQQLHSQAIIEACQVSKCFGGDIESSSGGDMQSSEVSTPSTARRLMSMEEVYPSPLMLNEACVCTTDAYGLEACVCPEGNVTNIAQRTLMPEADPFVTIGTSAVAGAMFAALPEALGDALYLSGRVSASNSYRVKWATNAAFVLASGSWMSAGASWLTSSGLQYIGVSESKARVGGNTAAFLVNASRNLSPTLAAATAANYAAGRFGLWAEKKMMKKIYDRNSQTQTLH